MRNRNSIALQAMLALQFAAIAPAMADTIFLKNGDRISGKIVSAAGGKIVVKPDFDKKSTITLVQDEITTFSSPTPVLLKLADGTMINQPVEQGPPGRVRTIAGGTLAPQPVTIAQIAKINPSTAWSGNVGVNGMYSHAAATSATLGLSADGTRSTDTDRITAAGAFNYGEQKTDGVTSTSANNWFAKGQYDYFITPAWYVYANTKFEADHVNQLSFRAIPGAGAGYQWYNQDDFHLSSEAGAAYIYEDYTTNPEADSRAAVRLSYHIDHSWADGRIVVYHDLTVLPSLEQAKDFLVQGDAGLRTSLTHNMYSEVKVNVNYDNDPAPGSQALTSQVLIGLGLTY